MATRPALMLVNCAAEAEAGMITTALQRKEVDVVSARTPAAAAAAARARRLDCATEVVTQPTFTPSFVATSSESAASTAGLFI
jgi:hypothetical protein